MRTVLLLSLTTLGGCFFVFDRDDDDDDRDSREDFVVDDDGRPSRPSRPRDTDAGDTDGAEPEAPVTCGDEAVRALVDALATGSLASCGHGSVFATATATDGRELQLQLFVDTVPDGDAPTAPYVVGTVFAADLSAVDAAGSARLVLGTGLAVQACSDIASEAVEEHVWVGVAGTVTYTVTDAQDEVQPWGEALFRADVAVQGLVLEDAAGDRCTVPDTTWANRWMGWLPG